MSKPQPHVEEFSFGPWQITAVKSHILGSEGTERQNFESQLGIPHVPEMIFNQNFLRIVNDQGCGVVFRALDALKRVDTEHDFLQVASAKAWKAARADCEHIENVVHPFDWTFSTDYSGTLLGEIKVEETTERIDFEQLKIRDKISFYSDVALFEDELHDCGCSLIGVKIRIMPTYLFVLMRFYMRVDDVVVRVNDTRLFHKAGTDYILREFSKRESKVSELNLAPSVIVDPNAIAEHLQVLSEKCEKLTFLPS